jgi:hypothetical protein
MKYADQRCTEEEKIDQCQLSPTAKPAERHLPDSSLTGETLIVAPGAGIPLAISNRSANPIPGKAIPPVLHRAAETQTGPSYQTFRCYVRGDIVSGEKTVRSRC